MMEMRMNVNHVSSHLELELGSQSENEFYTDKVPLLVKMNPFFHIVMNQAEVWDDTNVKTHVLQLAFFFQLV